MGSRAFIEGLHVGHGPVRVGREGCGRRSASGRYFGVEVEEMAPGAQIFAGLAVLAPVALSGLVLAFTPVWWIFTTYFWVAFPALGVLVRGISGLSTARPRMSSGRSSAEKELLEALWRHGELSPARAAVETSLGVKEADGMLRELAEAGFLEMRVRGGGIFYAPWGYENHDEHPRAGIEGRGDPPTTDVARDRS